MTRLWAALLAACLLAAPEARALDASGKAQVETVAVGDIRMGYYARGTGAPLLMIMGLGASMSDWDPGFLDELASVRRLIIIDNRGCGFSTDTAENHTSIAQMADDAAGLMKALGYSSLDVLGYSMGSEIAMQIAVRHPELAKTVTLLSTTPGGSHTVAPVAPGTLEGIALRTFTRAQTLAALFPEDPVGKEAASALLKRLIAARKAETVPSATPCSVETGQRQLTAVRAFADSNENYDAIAGLKMPVLVMGGRQDVVLPPANGKAVAERIPFAWVAWFEGGHLFWSQDYEKAATAVQAFLE